MTQIIRHPAFFITAIFGLAGLAGWSIGVFGFNTDNLILVALFGLAFIVITLMRPFAGLVILVVSTFLGPISPFVDGDVTLNRLLAFVVLGQILLRQTINRGKVPPPVFTWVDGLLALYVLVTGISIIFNGIGQDTYLLYGFLLVGYFYYWFIINLVHEHRQLRVLLNGLLATIALVAVAVIVDAAMTASSTNYYRFGGIHQVNGAGALCAIGVILSLWASNDWKMRYRWIGFGLAIMCLIAALLTGSRSALVGLIVTGLILLLFYRRNSQLLQLALVSLVLILVILPLLQDTLPAIIMRYESLERDLNAILQGDTVGDNKRRFLTQESWAAFYSSPLIGVGYGSFKDFAGTGSPTHNIYLALLAETGMAGFATIIALSAYVMLSLLRAIRQTRDDRLRHTAKFIFTIFVFYVMVHGLFHTSSLDRSTLIFYGLAMAAVRLIRAEAKQKSLAQQPAAAPSTAALPPKYVI